MIGRTLFSVTHRLRKSRALDVLAEIRGEAALPAEEVLARQWARLQGMLQHAESKVPYYRQVFADLGITARDIRTPADFAAFPVLTKDLIRAHGSDLIAEGTDRSTLLTHRSGGSTGVPLEFYHDRAATDLSDAGTYRNFLQCGWQPGEMIAFFWGFNDRIEAMSPLEFEARQFMRRSYQFDPFRQSDEDFARWLTTLRRIRPSIVYGYASSIGLFAEWALRTGARVPKVKGLFCTAEKLLPRQREAMERAFQSKAYDVYGSSEVRNIACECVRGTFHLNADFVYAEVEDPTMAEAQPFLLTGLIDRSMPFIRYRNEDCGTLGAGECGCGSGFPAMRLDIARQSDSFRFENGRVVHGEFFTHLFYGVEGVRMFQFRQVALDRVEVLAVPEPTAGGLDPVLAGIRSQVEALAPGQLTCDVRVVSEIPLSSAGKHRFTVSLVQHAAESAAGQGA
jgi:phenylacetate-CoA ligase